MGNRRTTHLAQPARRQLNGQRQPLQRLADGRNGRHILGRGGKPALGALGRLPKQLPRRTHLQPIHIKQPLLLQLHPLARRDQQRDMGGGGQQLGEEIGRGLSFRAFQERLQIIQHQQHLLPRHGFQHLRLRPFIPPQHQPQLGRYRAGNKIGVGHIGQRHKTQTVQKIARRGQPPCRFKCQPCFAHAARAQQGQQAAGGVG